MAKQHIDFTVPGSTTDTGEKDPTAIRPVIDGQPGSAATFNRPHENLRKRTEIIREILDEELYLRDADRALLIEGGGTITWTGAQDLASTGVFTITAPLLVRPFLAPKNTLAARTEIRQTTPETGVVIRATTVTTGGVLPARAYSGANKITVAVFGASGATLDCTVTGNPEDNIDITVNTAIGGTTLQALVTYLTTSTDTGPVAFRALGLTAELGSGATGSNLVYVSTPGGTADTYTLTGGLDAELHTITQTGLSAFFSDAANALKVGDTLAITYDTVNDGSRSTKSGRRQSLADAPESNSNADSNLVNLRRFPALIANAIPVCTVMAADQLVFANGWTLLKDTAGLTMQNISGHTVTSPALAAWADATTNPTNSITAQLNKVVGDLAASTGAGKVGYAGGPAWADGTTNPASSVETQIDKILTDLSNTTIDAGGARKIGLEELYSASDYVRMPVNNIHDALYRLVAHASSRGVTVYDRALATATTDFISLENPVFLPSSSTSYGNFTQGSGVGLYANATGVGAKYAQIRFPLSGPRRVRFTLTTAGFGAGDYFRIFWQDETSPGTSYLTMVSSNVDRADAVYETPPLPAGEHLFVVALDSTSATGGSVNITRVELIQDGPVGLYENIVIWNAAELTKFDVLSGTATANTTSLGLATAATTNATCEVVGKRSVDTDGFNQLGPIQSQAFSLECQVNLPAAAAGSEYDLGFKSSTGTSYGFGMLTSDQLIRTGQIGTVSAMTSSGLMANDGQTHLRITMNTNNVMFYVNGHRVSSINRSGNFGTLKPFFRVKTGSDTVQGMSVQHLRYNYGIGTMYWSL